LNDIRRNAEDEDRRTSVDGSIFVVTSQVFTRREKMLVGPCAWAKRNATGRDKSSRPPQPTSQAAARGRGSAL